MFAPLPEPGGRTTGGLQGVAPLPRCETFNNQPSQALACPKRKEPVPNAGTPFSTDKYRTSSVAEVSGGEVRDPAEWSALAKDDSTSRGMRFSIGLPSLDWTLSPRPNQQPGSFAPGEQTVIIGDTGHGKSSFVRRNIYRNCTLDKWGWGFPDRKTVILATEEELSVIAEACEFGVGDRLEHVARRSVRASKIGSSRKKAGHAIFAVAYEAAVQAHQSGRPVTDFLPDLVALDYDQAVNEPGESQYTDARINLANFMLRGVAEWNLDELEKWSGAKWAEVCKQGKYFNHKVIPFPADREHKVASVTTAQVRAQDQRGKFYDPDKSPIAEFAYIEDGEPRWIPEPGAIRLLGRDDYQGDKQALKDATNVFILYRPFPSSKIMDTDDGRKVVRQPTAYIIIDKARYGQRDKVVELAFSSSPDGKVGQWYDIQAEKAIALLEAGGPDVRPWKWDWDRRWRAGGFGSAILPYRKRRSPLDGIPYRIPTADEIAAHEQAYYPDPHPPAEELEPQVATEDGFAEAVLVDEPPMELYEDPAADGVEEPDYEGFDPAEWYTDDVIFEDD